MKLGTIYQAINKINGKSYIGQKIGSFGNLNEICKKYNLNYSRLGSFINKGKIPIAYFKNILSCVNCIDWEIIKI